MTVFDRVMNEIDKGMKGDNLCLSTGSPVIDDLIGGVGRSTYYLLGANLGVGKTAFADHAFILNPYIQTLKSDLKLRVFYYSFEIGLVKKIAKWVCYLIYRYEKIIIDIKEVYSKKSILASWKYELIKKYRDFIEQMMDHIHIFDMPLNPTGLYKELQGYAEKNGRIDEETKIVRGHEFKTRHYTANDPKEIVLYVEDHIALARGEKDSKTGIVLGTKKEKIDKGSEYAVNLRNFYGISKLAIQQFNREIADVERRRFGELSPQLEDFKESGNTQEDADIVMSLFNPQRYNLGTYGGLNVNEFGGRYRNLVVLKNRDGQDMKKHHLNFLGEVGHFRDLPDPFVTSLYAKARKYEDWQSAA